MHKVKLKLHKSFRVVQIRVLPSQKGEWRGSEAHSKVYDNRKKKRKKTHIRNQKLNAALLQWNHMTMKCDKVKVKAKEQQQENQDDENVKRQQ